MKKVKIFLVSLLTAILCLFCFVSCGERGVYRLTGYDPIIGNDINIDSDSTASYIELQRKDVAVVSLNLAGIATIEGSGTWTEVSKNKYKISVDGLSYDVTIQDDTMILDVKVGKIILEKD